MPQQYILVEREEPIATAIINRPDKLNALSRALMDDLGMIDLDFATGSDAAPAVRAAVDGYLNGKGA